MYSVLGTQYLVPWLWRLVICLGLLSAGWQSVLAKEPYLEFLRALQQRGYGEQALAYLDQIANRPDLPPELQNDFDLERSKCLRIAANEASEPEQRQSRLAEAKRVTEKFLAEHPEHPAASAALLDEADDSLVRAQNSLAMVRFAQDDATKEKAAKDARTALTTTAKQFEAATKRLKERLDALPKDAEPDKGPSTARADLEFTWVRSRLSQTLCDYLLAQTYDDLKDPDRVGLLKKASKAFDAIYQEYRGQRIGSIAHMWHGKALEEQGDLATAMDFWDEVLVGAPEGPDADPDLAPLFGQAELFYIRGLATKEEPKTIVQEGDQWLSSHKKWQTAPQYQGIALETAKARLAYSEKLRPGTEKNKTLHDALVALEAIGKAETEYRHEALSLRRKSMGKLAAGGTLSFEESLATGDEEAAERNWTEAEKRYKEAADLAAKSKEAKKQETAQHRLVQMIYKQALAAYSAGDLDKVLTLAGEVVGKYPTSPMAEDASSLALATSLRVFTEAKGDAKEAALARLHKIAEVVIGKYPGKQISDDAHMALAQAYITRGDLPKAQEQLSGIQEKSKSYPVALQILGQIRWKQYVDGKKENAAGKAEEIQKLRAEAVAHLQASAEKQRATWQAGSDPMPATLFDTQLLLAEIHLEGGEYKQAAEGFGALVQSLQALKPTTVGLKGQRAFVGAVRAAILLNQPAQAAEAALALAAISGDEAQPNAVLVDLAKLLGDEVRKAQAPPAGTEPADNTQALANPLVAQLTELNAKLLENLAGRKELSVDQLIYVGEACQNVQKNDKAYDLYSRALKTIDSDPSAKAAVGERVARVRAKFVGLLRGEGKLEEAQKQVDALIANHPNALEPLMEKGYILQSLAERDPRKWDDCVKHWSNLTDRLSRTKPKPKEYYDVLYNAALALVRQARQANNKEKALQAERMIKATLVLTPQLNGPEMVAKYNALLAVAVSMRTGGAPMPTASSR